MLDFLERNGLVESDEKISIMQKYNGKTIKTSKWILSGGYFRCSICNEKALLKLDKSKGGTREYEQQKTNFCPYCGAKMEKKGETS